MLPLTFGTRFQSSLTILLLLPACLPGAPVAVDDTYSLNEDESLNVTGGGLVFEASFETGSSVLGEEWRFLDSLENENGNSDNYPVDGDGKLWNSVDFDDSTSTIGPWETGTAPFQGGSIDAFPPDTPENLDGVFAAGNGQNLVSTYLFRQSFNLTSAQAVEPSWVLENLMDDGGIVYLNGEEIYRTPTAPAGPVETTTLFSVADEANLLSATLDLSGKLVEGQNIIAVEVHQNSLISSDVGFFLSLTPASSSAAAGFSYLDDAFNNTTQPNFATGSVDPTGGFEGAGLFVQVGNRPTGSQATSGGWSRDFSLPAPATATVSFRYRLTFDDGYESDEFGEALFEIDGVRFGSDLDNSLKRFYGDGNGGGGTDDTGWQFVTFDIPLSAGNHTMLLGAHSSKSTANGEVTSTWFDDIEVTIPATGGGVLLNDTGDAPVAFLASTTSNGTVNLNQDGSFTYQPNPEFHGTDTFTYLASDPSGASNIATVSLTINPVNDPPVAFEDLFQGNEGSSVVINAPGVLINDSDIESSSLTAVLESDVSNGTLQLNPDGSFTYTPDPGFFGSDGFTYFANDGELDSTPVEVALEIAPINDPPIANDDVYTIVENSSVDVSISSGLEEVVFSSDFNDPTIPSLISGAGTLESVQGFEGLGPEGNSFTGQFLRNAASGNPADPITLTLTDLPPHESLSLRFLLAIIDTWDNNNDRLTITLDGAEIFRRGFRNNRTGQEFDYPAGSLIVRDQELAFSAGANNQRDAGYDMSRAREFRDIPHTASTATIEFFVASNSWDGGDDESWAIDNLEVAVSASPTESLVAQGAIWKYLDDGSDQGMAWRLPDFDDGSWASGPSELGYGDGDEATVVAFGPNSNNKHVTTYFRHQFQVTDASQFGTLTLGLVRDDGAAVYLNGSLVAIDNLDPNANFDALANLNPGLTGDATWSEFTIPEGLLVEGNNVLAVEIHQDSTNSSDISLNAYLLGKRITAAGLLANDSDPENDLLTAEKLTDPQHGTVTLNPDGTFSYLPDVNYEGIDSFTYRVSDGEFNSAPATVTFTMTPGASDFPVTNPDVYSTPEDVTLSVTTNNGVLLNDSDPDSPDLTVFIESLPSHGALSLTEKGGFTYTPAPDYSGPDGFTYRVFDGSNTARAETVTINVTSVNDPPAAAPESYLTAPGGTLSVEIADGVLANDSDPDNPVLTAVLVSTTTSGNLDLSANGSFTYTPNGGFSGPDTFSYLASDGVNFSDVITVSIQVNAAPVAIDNFLLLTEDNPLILDPNSGVLANDVDIDPLTAVLISEPSNGTLSLNLDGSLIYIPDGDFSGTDSFMYRADDSLQQSEPATVTISVTGINDSPSARDDSYEVEIGTELNIPASLGVLANDSDSDSANISANLLVDVAHGTLILRSDGSFTYQPEPGFTGTDHFVYTASDSLLSSGESEVEIEVYDLTENIVINEIMFNPLGGNDLEEFIELTNIGTTPVSLEGWQFTNGVSFTFPDVTLDPGGFLVVVADTAGFEAAYGALPNVIGNWTGKLSNSGERIQLSDQAGTEIDEVRYYDQGDWATRQRVTVNGEPGWSWGTAADGGGSSLELINPSLSNKHGQNWGASLNEAPTPTFANTVASDNTAPLILDVEHFPRIPTSSDPIAISAELRDEAGEPIGGTLYYRVSAQNPGSFQSAPMLDDGNHGDADPYDGVYGFVLPPAENGTIFEFYIEATDGTHTRTWPAPASDGQTANALLQVDDEANTYDHGFYRIILPVSEYNQWQSINRGSNAMMNATVILDDGSGPSVRYLCGMRVRGAGSRSHTPPPMRVALPRDDSWNNSTRMNLNTRFSYLQFLGMKLFQASDMRAPDTYRIQVRINGGNIARNDGFDYGSMVHVQPLSSEFIDDKFESDSDGNLYKKVRPDREFRWLDGNIGGYESDGWGKQTNSSENDWSDLDELLRVMNNASEDPDYLEQVERVADVDQWMQWFAAMAILANGETNISNGADDDYSIYRGAVDRRFVFIPHDLDTILSIGDGSRKENPEHTIFDMIEDRDVLNPLVPFFNHPEIIERYFLAIRALLQTTFSKPEFDELLDNNLTGWVPEAQIEQMRSFMDARRIYIESQITPVIGPPDSPALATSQDTIEAPHGPLYISEILAINRTTLEVDGTYPDLIELHNSGPTPISLDGMSLSDDPANPTRFVFPVGTTIASGGYLVLRGGTPLPSPGIYTGFNLDGQGETLSLYDTPANGSTLLDTVTFGLQVADHSIGRIGPDSSTWSLCLPTVEFFNIGVELGSPSGLRFNEWMTQPSEVFEDEFVELFNPSLRPVAIGGLRITDEPVNEPGKHRIPSLSFVAPQSLTLLAPLGSDANPLRADELPFRLSSTNEWIALFGDNRVLIDQVHFVNQQADLSLGRAPDGSGTYQSFTVPTPGASNTSDFSREELLLSNLRISEMMYDPSGGSDLEFIELENIGDQPLELKGVSFTNGISFDFPDLILQPGEFILVVKDQAAFSNFYGNGFLIAGEYSGKLDNGGERIRLEITSINAGIHDFEYDDWFPAADGAGFSLEFSDTLLARSDWHDRDNWAPSLSINGTPGESGTFSLRLPEVMTVSLPNSLTVSPELSYGPFSPAAVSYQWTAIDGPAALVFDDPTSAEPVITFPQPGIYTVRVDAETFGFQQSRTFTINTYDSFGNFISTFFGVEIPGITGPNDDPDRDGVDNLSEFAFMTNPGVHDASLQPVPVFDAGESTLLVTYSPNFLDPEQYSVVAEVSSDLENWSTEEEQLSSEVVSDNYGFQTINARDHFQAGSTHTRFMRVRVHSQP